MSRGIYFATHPDVIVDPRVPVPQWPLSQRAASACSCCHISLDE